MDMEKKAADNKKMLRPVFRLRMNAAGLFNRQTKRKFRGWGDAYNQKRAELSCAGERCFYFALHMQEGTMIFSLLKFCNSFNLSLVRT